MRKREKEKQGEERKKNNKVNKIVKNESNVGKDIARTHEEIVS